MNVSLDMYCEICSRQMMLLTKEFDKNTVSQCIKGFSCRECGMTYMCRNCYTKWWDSVPSASHNEDEYQSFVKEFHFSKNHYSVDLV